MFKFLRYTIYFSLFIGGLAFYAHNLGILPSLLGIAQLKSGESRKINPNHKDLPIHEAVKIGDLSKVTSMLNSDTSLLNKYNSKSRPLIYLAAAEGHLELLKLLVERGADIQSQERKYGSTPLHAAAEKNNLEVISWLIKNGADPNFKSSYGGLTPMHHAAFINPESLVAIKHLHALGGDIHSTTGVKGNNLVHIAASVGNLQLIYFLAKNKVDLNLKNKKGMNPLFFCDPPYSTKTAEYLLKLGVNINQRDFKGRTPLLFALKSKDYKLAEFLIDQGADPNIKSLKGISPLYYTGTINQPGLLKKLLAAKANPFEVYGNRTITDWLTHHGHDTSVKIINEYAPTTATENNIAKNLVVARDLESFKDKYLIDKHNIIDSDSQKKLSFMLHHLYNETGVDLRIAILNGESGNSIDAFAANYFSEIKIGEKTNGRGVLFLYDKKSNKARIEVGYDAEGFIPDILANYILEKNFIPSIKDSSIVWALRSNLTILSWRIREAILKNSFDPTALALVSNKYLSGGAGAKVPVPQNRSVSSTNAFNGSPMPLNAKHKTPQSVYQSYLDWLLKPSIDNAPNFFTKNSYGYLQGFIVSEGYKEFIFLREYGKSSKFLIKGDLAVQYFTDTPLANPHFYKKVNGTWVMDMISEINNTRSNVGMKYNWTLRNLDDEYITNFVDELVGLHGEYVRFKDGDNRELPAHI